MELASLATIVAKGSALESRVSSRNQHILHRPLPLSHLQPQQKVFENYEAETKQNLRSKRLNSKQLCTVLLYMISHPDSSSLKSEAPVQC